MSDYTITTDFSARVGTTDANAGALLDTELSAIATHLATKYDSSTTLAVANGGTGATTTTGARTNLGIGALAQQPAALVALLRGDILTTSGTTGTNISLDSVTLTAGDRVILFGVVNANAHSSAAAICHWKFYMQSGTATVVFDHNNTEHKFGNYGSTAGENCFQGATIASCTVGGTAVFSMGQILMSNGNGYVESQLLGVVVRGA